MSEDAIWVLKKIKQSKERKKGWWFEEAAEYGEMNTGLVLNINRSD